MAQERSQEILIEAKEKALRIRLESEKEINKQKNKLAQEKNNLDSLRSGIDEKLDFINKENNKISDQLKFIKNQKSELKENRELYAKKIEEASDITLEEGDTNIWAFHSCNFKKRKGTSDFKDNDKENYFKISHFASVLINLVQMIFLVIILIK